MTTLEGIPLLGSVVSPVVQLLYQVPVLNTLLAPIIGQSTVASFNVDPNSLASTHAATAFTDKVTSFDGTQISVNYFPSIDVATGDSLRARTPSSGVPAWPPRATPTRTARPSTAPSLVWRLSRTDDGPLTGFNVVTWDPRGEFASGGVLQLDNPFYEGRDVSSIITWLSSTGSTDGVDNPASAQVKTGAAIGGYTNPAVVGMVGLSYGGGIQNVTAGTDPRIKAIVPAWSWNSLNSSLYPDGAFKTAYGSLLTLDLVMAKARINTQIYAAVLLGDLLGFLTQSQQAVLGSSGPTSSDEQDHRSDAVPARHRRRAVPAAAGRHQREILSADSRVTTKMIWTCIGHGECLDPGSLSSRPRPTWNPPWRGWTHYVDGTPGCCQLVPTFTWFDQTDHGYVSTPACRRTPGFNTSPSHCHRHRRAPIHRAGPGWVEPAVAGDAPVLAGRGIAGHQRDQRDGGRPHR